MTDDQYRELAGVTQEIKWQLVSHTANNFSLVVDGLSEHETRGLLEVVMQMEAK